MLEERDASDNYKALYVYGNYIDEVLVKSSAEEGTYNYVQDHLYSPVALTDVDGIVVERYEYDAYGQPTVMDGSYVVKQPADYLNNYLFTGREVDILDNGSLKILPAYGGSE